MIPQKPAALLSGEARWEMLWIQRGKCCTVPLERSKWGHPQKYWKFGSLCSVGRDLCEESLGDGRCDGFTQCEQVQCRTTVRVEMLLDCSVEMTHLILVCHCVYTGEVKVHGIIHPTFFLRHSVWVSP